MKKIVSMALLCAMALTMLVGCGSKKDEGKFIVGFDADFPPYGYMDDNGEYVGFDLDLAKEVCDRNGWEVVYQPIDWDSKDMELSSGNISCIWNGFTITDERNQMMSFTPAYLNNDQVLVVRKGGDIKSLADAAGKTIGTQAGSSGEEAIADNPDFEASVKKVVKYDDYLTALTDLSVGGVDGIVMDSIVAEYEITVGNLDLEVLSESLAKEGYGIGFRKDSDGAALRDKVWATLEEMGKDGKLAEITKKWFGNDISVIGK